MYYTKKNQGGMSDKFNFKGPYIPISNLYFSF